MSFKQCPVYFRQGVSDTCLNGLVSLLSKKDEAVVAESVVVVKKLLQTQPSEHKAIITHMAKLVHDITVPMARASILWLLGEYSDQVPKIAPDVLRVMAKNFTNEEDIVKLQVRIGEFVVYTWYPGGIVLYVIFYDITDKKVGDSCYVQRLATAGSQQAGLYPGFNNYVQQNFALTNLTGQIIFICYGQNPF